MIMSLCFNILSFIYLSTSVDIKGKLFKNLIIKISVKMKTLKPSHREKKRYILIKGGSLDQKEIDKIILDYIGILGYAKACPLIVKREKENIVLAVNRKEIDKVRASFLISGKKIEIRKVSGTLRGLGK